MTDKFIFTKNLSVYIGKIKDNSMHKHYALQITISLGAEIVLSTQSQVYKTKSAIIKPLHPHQLDINHQNVILILINPASRIGHFIFHHLLTADVDTTPTDWLSAVKVAGEKWYSNKINGNDFLQQFQELSDTYFAICNHRNHLTDKRILHSIEILEEHTEGVLPLESIAGKVHLSPSRFIHLFKSETGISYRRMQLWIKLMKSFSLFQESTSLTSLAYASGFSDSAHYARTFKETFGMNPSNFKKTFTKE